MNFIGQSVYNPNFSVARSYLADQCWNGGFIYLIMFRRIKRKAPLPPSNGNNSNSCEPKAKPASERSDRAAQNGKRTRKFGVIARTPASKDSKESKDSQNSEQENGRHTPMEVDSSQPEASNTEDRFRNADSEGRYRSRRSDGGVPDLNPSDLPSQVSVLVWVFKRKRQGQFEQIKGSSICVSFNKMAVRPKTHCAAFFSQPQILAPN